MYKSEKLRLENRIKILEITKSVPEKNSEVEDLIKVALLKEDSEVVVSDEAVGTASSIKYRASEPKLSKRYHICATLCMCFNHGSIYTSHSGTYWLHLIHTILVAFVVGPLRCIKSRCVGTYNYVCMCVPTCMVYIRISHSYISTWYINTICVCSSPL